MAPVSVGRLWLQYHYLLLLVAPVSVACGSSICRLWLQCILLFVAPVVLSPVVCGSSICRLVLWLQAPVSPVVHGSSLSPVSVVCVSSICRSWLWQWLRYLSLMASASLRYLSFVAPVFVVVHESSTICRSWLHCAIGLVVACGSSICCSWLRKYLQYLFLSLGAPAVAPVSPVSSVVDGFSTISCGCCLWLQY